MGDYHRSTINVTFDQKKVDALGYFKDPVCLAAIRDEEDAKKLLGSDNPIDRAFAQIYRTSLLWPGDIDPDREDCRNTSEFGENFSLRVHYEGKAYTDDIRKAFRELAPVLVYEEGKVVCVWGEECNEGFVVYLMVGGKLVESPYFGFYSARHHGEPYPEFDFMVSGEGNTVITLTIPELKQKFPDGKWPPAELESDGTGWLQVAETLPGFDVIYDYTKEVVNDE